MTTTAPVKRRGRKPGPRLPWAPIVPHLREPSTRKGTDRRGGASDLARLIGVARGALDRVKREGATLDYADRIAEALGLHPWEIWGDAYWRACDAAVVDRPVRVAGGRRSLTPEHRAKLAEAARRQAAECRTRRGVRATEETKARIRASWGSRWVARWVERKAAA